MHGQKLGRWVARREAGGLALEAPGPTKEVRQRWLRRHRGALVFGLLAIGVLTAFWLVRERLSYPAYVQTALRGEIREIRYEIHPGLWVTVREAEQIGQIAGWLADARGGEDRWGGASSAANCQMHIRMADGRVHCLWLSPTGPFRMLDTTLQPNYYVAEIRWGPHRRYHYAQMGISEVYRRLPAASRPDVSLLPLAPLQPGTTQPATGPTTTQPAQ